MTDTAMTTRLARQENADSGTKAGNREKLSDSRPWPYLTLGALMALAFGTLVAIAVGAILALAVRANFVNTVSLLDARAVALIEGMERQMAAEANQAERAAFALAKLQATGFAGEKEKAVAFEALLESAPAVEGLLLIADGEIASLFRASGGTFVSLPGQATEADVARIAGPVGDGGAWGVPAQIGGSLFHNFAVRFGRKPGAFAMALVGQDMVSQVMRQVAPGSDATVFLLTESGEVISHSARPDLFGGAEIMKLDSFPDPNLRKLADATENKDFPQASAAGIRVHTSLDGNQVFLTKTLSRFSAAPFVLGVYFPAAEIGAEMLRAVNSLLIGLGGLILSVGAAIALGRYIARPISQVAATAMQFSDFRLEEIKPLPRSHVVEIDNQIRALNRMRATLLQFTRYVPRLLVARLMRTGVHLDEPEEREVTILFSDIMGFTGLAEHMTATQVAQLLNRHFEMIAAEVEATGGTIDKFMGDSVMAFWGAPEHDGDHALHAIRAAQAISRTIREDNARRKAGGEPELRMRMGIHTGKVVVGDIGSPERQNYTVVGDAVNVAQRLEQLAKELMPPDDDIIVLVSSEMVSAAGARAKFTPLGKQTIRGRKGPVSVCLLHTETGGTETVAGAD
jgi:adenylate cyclase